jgi:hypothetical protein
MSDRGTDAPRSSTCLISSFPKVMWLGFAINHFVRDCCGVMLKVWKIPGHFC